MVNCPQCDALIDVDEDELDAGDVIECEECGSALRVLSTDPLELEADADDEDEDDEDFDDDEDEDDEEDEDDDEFEDDELEDDEDDDEKVW
jgi:alpha-aminoadipate carrier protein LysW